MRRDWSHLFPLISIVLLFSIPSYGQAWSNILATSRAINWAGAGLPVSFTDKGGSNTETTTNPWTIPTRTQSGSTISPSGVASTDLSNINTALSSCTDGHYVLLGSGTFLIQSTIVMYQHSCSLRGSGPQSTILKLSGAGIIYMGAASAGGSCTPNSGLGQGSSSIVCNSLSGTAPAFNDIIQINQCDTGYSGRPCSGTPTDNGSLFVCGQTSSCATDVSVSPNSQYQFFVATSVSNSSGTYTIGISPQLYMPNWSTARTAGLSWNSPTYNGIGVGVEDMTIWFNGPASVNESIQMNNVYASWVKGVRFVGSPTIAPLQVAGAVNSLISNNYYFSDIALDGGYPPSIQFTQNTATLELNNIKTSGVPWDGTGGNVGNVLAYNYGRDTFTQYNENQPFDHHPYSSFDLFEGNQYGETTDDAEFGTHGLNTFFRNYLPCWDTPYSVSSSAPSPRGMVIDQYQRFDNSIGNAIGTSSQCTDYQGGVSGSGYIFDIDTTVDSLTSPSLMRWGNVSGVQQSSDTPANSGIRFVSSEVPTSMVMPSSSFPNAVTWQNSVPSNNNLPCSFFLAGYTPTTCTPHSNGGTGLSFWKVCTSWATFPTSCSTTKTQPFPPAGPDVSSGPYVNGYAYDIPAAIAWYTLPIDSTYQNSYTITASSWSGGTETLTVSGLSGLGTCGSPTIPCHLIGPFQFSGVTSACIPSKFASLSTNPNSEALITGSSTTQVTYALTSNPGVSCTGTMLFPDVRQFDERVYENDPGGTPPNPPTGLSATVQ